jgi:hypothetical protein
MWRKKTQPGPGIWGWKKGLIWRLSPKVQNRRKPVKEKNIWYYNHQGQSERRNPNHFKHGPHTKTHTQSATPLPGCSTPCQKENSQWLVKTLSFPFYLTSWNLGNDSFCGCDKWVKLCFFFFGCKWWQVCWLCVKGKKILQTIFSLFMNEYVGNVNGIVVVVGPSSHIIRP